MQRTFHNMFGQIQYFKSNITSARGSWGPKEGRLDYKSRAFENLLLCVVSNAQTNPKTDKCTKNEHSVRILASFQIMRSQVPLRETKRETIGPKIGVFCQYCSVFVAQFTDKP